MSVLCIFSRYRHLLWITTLVLVASSTLLLAACGGTSKPTTSDKGPTFQVSIIDSNDSFLFSPTTLTIPKGATVIWTNMSYAPHPVNSDTNAFSSPGNMVQSQTFEMVFTTAGTYPYHCGLHPYMKGKIIVTP